MKKNEQLKKNRCEYPKVDYKNFYFYFEKKRLNNKKTNTLNSNPKTQKKNPAQNFRERKENKKKI